MKIQKICPYCRKKITVGTKCSCSIRDDKYDKRFSNTKEWKKLRLSIIKRDGSICQRCWNKYGLITTEDLQAHHILPRLYYPELALDPNNLVCICGKCNKILATSGKLDFKFTSKELEDSEIYI